MEISKDELRDLRKAVTKGLKKVIKSLKEGPSTVIVFGSETGESETSIAEITSWLFKRRQDNGNKGN